MKIASQLTRVLAPLWCLLVTCHVGQSATYVWNVDPPGPNAWNVNANWSPNTGNPAAGDTALFSPLGIVSDALTVNNIVSINTSVGSLQFTNNATGNWHVTQIPAGVTLTVSTSLIVGGLTTATGPSLAAASGAGTLLVTGNTLQVGQGNTPSAITHNTLDLSGLSNFVYNAASGTVSIGSGNRSAGDFKMAASSNSITAGTANLNSASSSSSTSGAITLGGGTNLLNANTINIAAGNSRSSCTVSFPGDTGGLRVRGTGGSDADRATLTLAYRNSSGSGGGNTATVNLSGHPVDFKLNTLTLGRAGNVAANNGTGTLQFDYGTVDATNVLMAITGVVGDNATGNLTVATNATLGTRGYLVVGDGGISLCNQISGNTASPTGNLNISGGSVTCSGSITKANANSGGTANITLSDGALLALTSPTALIGSSAIPIDNINIYDSTLALPVNAGTATMTVGTLSPGGSGNKINISALPGTTVFPAQFPLIAYAYLNGIANFSLGTLPGTYEGYISNNLSTLSIDLVVTGSSSRSDVWRGNVSGDWDTSTVNWVYSGTPTTFQQGDSVVFDDTLTGTPNVNLVTGLLPNAVGFNNSTHNYVLAGTGKLSGLMGLTKQGTGSLTLSGTGGDDFSGGILVGAGTLVLANANSAISGGLAVNAAATAQVGNSDTNGSLPSGALTIDGTLVLRRSDAFTISTPISGSGSVTQSGTGTSTLSAANNYTGPTVINSGTLALAGSGTLSNSAQVQVSGANLDVSAMSRQSVFTDLRLTGGAITVALTNSAVTNIAATSLTLAGGVNQLNVAAFPPLASYPVTFTVLQLSTPISGTFNLATGSLPPATPPYTATVTLSPDQTAVLLTVTGGPIEARPAVVWTGAEVPNLKTNWSERLNWQLPGAPQPGENLFFGGQGTYPYSALTTPGGGPSALYGDWLNNRVDADTTVSSLSYTNLDVQGTYHNTWVNSGRTLTLTNAGLTVGGLDSGSVQKTFASISGSALNVLNTNGNVQVWLGYQSTTGSQAALDLSALNTFTADVSRLLVGANIGSAVNRPSGILYLGRNNSIIARFQTTSSESGSTTANGAIIVGDCNSNAGSPSYLYLGQVNNISADVLAIGRQKASAHLLFNPIYANVAPYPTATFQGANSSLMSFFDVGDGAGNTGTTTLGADADFSGGIVTAAIDTLNVGRASGGTSGSGTTTGLLNFDAGTITANTVNIGLQPVTGSKVGIGTLAVGSNTVMGVGATLNVSGPLTLGLAGGGAGAATTSGTLGITNGIVHAGTIVAGSGSLSSINLSGGTLAVAGSVGSSTAPLGSLTLAPLGTPDNNRNVLQLGAGQNPSVSVSTLNLDAMDTTSNIINVGSVGPVGATPVELALIQYQSMVFTAGSTFNVRLGTMPSGYTGYLTNDTARSMIGLVLTSAQYPQPRITGFALQSASNLVVSGVNGFANAPYYVLASTNVALPLVQWTRVGTNLFNPNGTFGFTNRVDPNTPQLFYQLQVQ